MAIFLPPPKNFKAVKKNAENTSGSFCFKRRTVLKNKDHDGETQYEEESSAAG
jgi:hypothetical protein